MKFSSWLNALKAGRPRRPIRNRPRGSRPGTRLGNLSVENLEARTVPAFFAPVDYAAGGYVYAVVAGDFNGDEVTDLAVASYDSNELNVLLGNSDGTFQPVASTSPAGWPTSLAVGDFNEDGKDDLASVNYSGVNIHLSNGNGTFQAANPVLSTSYTTSVAVGDFDADGNLDIAATSNFFVIDGYYWGYYGGYYPYGHYEGQANVLMGNGNGTFDAPQTTDLGYGAHSGAIAEDFNGDGKDDLATVDGTSLLKVSLANSSGILQAPAAYGTGWSPHSVAVGDVNSDGIKDLVTADYYGLSVFLGNGAGGTGNGTFQAAKNVATGYYTSSVATGDFNADGKLDLAASVSQWVVDYWGYWGYYGHYEHEVQVLLGYDNGHFAAPDRTFVELAWGNGLVSGDFDGDTRIDVATGNSDLTLSVLINDTEWLPLPPPSVSITSATIDEGNSGGTSASFTVSIPFAHTEDIAVHYETANGSASAGSDYTGASGDAIIPAGETFFTIPISILGDRVGEWDETFTVNISSADAPIADSQGAGLIIDDEPRVTITDESVTEENTGSITMTFTVTLSDTYDQAVVLNYSTANGSASAGSDFTLVTNGSVTIGVGSMSQVFTVSILGDRLAESTEYFSVNLTGTNSLVVDPTGTGYIIDNEPLVWIDDVVKLEGTSKGKNVFTTEFIFTISLSEAYDEAITVNFSTGNGSANADSDFTARSGSVTFAPGETEKKITIQVKQDRSREQDEWFALKLTSASTNAVLYDSQGMGWILDDDRRGNGHG